MVKVNKLIIIYNNLWLNDNVKIFHTISVYNTYSKLILKIISLVSEKNLKQYQINYYLVDMFKHILK